MSHRDFFPPETKQARTWGMLCHLSALSLFVGVPFGNIAGPLIVWLLKRRELYYVDEQGKEALNFQITMSIVGIFAGLSFFLFIGIFLTPLLIVYVLIMSIVAAVRTADGRPWRYPLTIRFIR